MNDTRFGQKQRKTEGPMSEFTHPVTGEVYRDLSPRESALFDVIATLNRCVDDLETVGVERERARMSAEQDLVDVGNEVACLIRENDRLQTRPTDARCCDLCAATQGQPHVDGGPEAVNSEWQNTAHEPTRREVEHLREMLRVARDGLLLAVIDGDVFVWPEVTPDYHADGYARTISDPSGEAHSYRTAAGDQAVQDAIDRASFAIDEFAASRAGSDRD